jgi:cyclic beta-1,2-glucan synthetase
MTFPGDNLLRKYADELPPLRLDLFSGDQMQQFGKTLARKHKIVPGRASNKLLKRLSENEEVLLEVNHLLIEAAKENRRVVPAGEWLLDNYYLIQEQIHIGKKHLPKGYSEDLPRLLTDESDSIPRVYDIASEIISHSDARIEMRSLSSFITSYQTVAPLKLGELWAVPIMLRLALIENLRRLSTQIAIDRINQNLADYWAEKMISTAEKDPKSLILIIADMARSSPPMVSSFVAELSRQLQGKGPALALPLSWIEQRLYETGQTTSELINAETQKQATDQVSISNSINSLRFLGTIDWRDFVEATSVVEHILREDLSGTYSRMDFSTRDSYRHVVENIARKSDITEQDVARKAIGFAKESSANNGVSERKAHVGYYLVGNGLKQMEQSVKMKLSASEKLEKFVRGYPLLFYLGSILIVTLIVGGSLFAKAYSEDIKNWILVLVVILLVLCASQLAVSLINWLTTLFIKPKFLPRMDYSIGIPPESSTLVVIPAMLTSKQTIEELIESLEVYYLANKDENLHFGLLTDFRDANEETLPEDRPLLQTAERRIKDLNVKYANEQNNVFYLFHRPRKWNSHEKIWMGYERKRGKLTELNTLLRTGNKEFFSLTVGRLDDLSDVRYVLTIDADTQLPRDAASKIVATMAHPLNRAFYNEKKHRVTEGYGILQPRVALSLAGANNSLYARLHGSDLGIDPYTRTTSDVYQDLFNEGSFIGKGLYEVEIFARALDDRFPENRILSHDLLEGCYTRSGLLSDVQLYEEYPSEYIADVRRRHRWIRGDWQIASWILPVVPGANKKFHKNPLSALSKWKIFDNIRRSLVPASLVLLLLAGWLILKDAWFWTLAVTAIVFLPFLIITLRDIFHKPKELQLTEHIKESIEAIFNNFLNTIYTIVCLPHEAYYTVHAIFRTSWRMLISGRHLLEWNPYGGISNNNQKNLGATYLSMWFGPFAGISMLGYLIIISPIYLLVALPVLALWIASPAIAWLVSRPLTKIETDLSKEERIFLRKLARKTWAFFEFFVGREDNWLPPDNYQEHPVERIAHRTSPTNIGLSLLSNITAWDFGYISTGHFIERTANTFITMQNMKRYRGHFYNWYDTVSLQPLPPHYVSTVDSGNLAGHLLTLRQGILAIANQKIAGPNLFEGIYDTLRILKETMKSSEFTDSFQKELDLAIKEQPYTLRTIKASLGRLIIAGEKMLDSGRDQLERNAFFWLETLNRQCRNSLEELVSLAPWLSLPETPPKFSGLLDMEDIPTLRELSRMELNGLPGTNLQSAENTADENEWLYAYNDLFSKTKRFVKERLEMLDHLSQQCTELADLDFDFLYDKSQHLLSIGYNADENRRDPSFYDLLASEARLSTFVGISQGKLPQESWFALGRQLTNSSNGSILLSWSGSMFEYLMPLLVMPTHENTLLHQTNKAVVRRQIEYGRSSGVPWGISESCYNLFDAQLNYQYRAFGVPGLGFKRGLAEDLVIAPYASILALMVEPEEAILNLQDLSTNGFLGRFGFYESIDYTPARLPRGKSHVVVRSFMAHHHGMSLIALSNLLLNKPMQKRFESEPQFQASLLLLQERVPKATGYYSAPSDVADISMVHETAEMRIIDTPDTPVPEVQLLSNGRYHLMITNAGGGYSRWKDIAVTRWREDGTTDHWGNFCFIRDLEKGFYWSTAHQPSCKQARNYQAVFSQGRVEFRRRDTEIETHTEIVVSPEDDVEIRRIHITNRSGKKRIIEVTSYAEVVLTSQAADSLHPAFSNLFVQTRIIPERQAILCTRRPRSAEEKPPWMFHLMKARNRVVKEVSYETDRMKFVGRLNNLVTPRAMTSPGPLSGTQGPVLDPIVSIRYLLTINPLESTTVDLVFGMGETLEITEGLIEKYQEPHFTDRAFELAWTHSQVVLRQINATEADAQLYSSMAGSVIYANGSLRADPSILIKNQRGQSGLWSYSISGDLPIVLVKISEQANINLVRKLVQAHAYWRLKGLIVDLVIWNEDYGGYRQQLQNQLIGLVSMGIETDMTERPGGIFVRVADQISDEDRILIQTVARIIIIDSKGALAYQLTRKPIAKPAIPFLSTQQSINYETTKLPARSDLQFFNGLGGFSPDGKEYIIETSAEQSTPLPWINVIANPGFGTIISESGQSYTWVENAHEFRLSPWENDPVSDAAGEAFYIRDEDTGYYWSPTPLPARGRSNYRARHGFGYSVFEHIEEGIHSEMWVFVDKDASIKITILKLRNQSDKARRISVTGYVEWVLGDLKPKSTMHIVTEIDPSSGALFAKNPYNKEFGDRVCFLDVNDTTRSFTADRAEFIGRNRSLRNPDGMSRRRLSGKSGAALDPCGAMQVGCSLSEGQEHELIFLLGSAQNNADATHLVNQFRISGVAHAALKNVRSYWEKTLGVLQVQTPDPALNVLTNGWLIYQALACRIYGRSGYYQSGGAFGFRDQLQDIMAVIHADHELAREHILHSASRQFREGDVQHWWHPPIGRGVRTRCSDDFLWLPLATARYLRYTGDEQVLYEKVPFLEGRQLNPDEESYYDMPARSEQTATLYDHCVLAIQHGLRFGVNGLPLIGSGDWNDGMDHVGRHGKGESVWLAFFLYEVLREFATIAGKRKDLAFADQCTRQGELLARNIDKNAWDGEWYRRAYFDDGTPLGSSNNDECRIDSIAQSWSVLSGAGEPGHSQQGMESAYRHLVRKDLSIIQLLDPPFDKSTMNPGYIKGYIPGVRENGGQYTHAAIWMVMAFAALKKAGRTWELFSMINPVNHGSTSEKIARYKVEPYVVAADVYSVSIHSGRGGWTWYTGSAGWMYRLIIESILGLRKEENTLFFDPCIPPEWNSFTLQYKYHNTTYHISVEQTKTGEGLKLTVDGLEQKSIALVDDRKIHEVIFRLPVSEG